MFPFTRRQRFCFYINARLSYTKIGQQIICAEFRLFRKKANGNLARSAPPPEKQMVHPLVSLKDEDDDDGDDDDDNGGGSRQTTNNEKQYSIQCIFLICYKITTQEAHGNFKLYSQ